MQPNRLSTRRRAGQNRRSHRRSRSFNHTSTLFSPSSLRGLCGPLELDLIVEKAKSKLNSHERDFDSLIHATEQLVTAQRLKDLGHKIMIETLRTLQCSTMVKKKSNELADLLHNMYLKEIERTENFNNLLDALQNVRNTHRVTAHALQDEYDKASKKYVDFAEKHPELDFSMSSVSSCSTDEELDVSDSSVLNFGRVSLDDSVLGNSRTGSPSTSISSSFFSFIRKSPAQEKILQAGEELKENVDTRRNDFVNAVNILEKKSMDLVVLELNELCNLYRESVNDEEEPEAYLLQAL